MAENPPQLPAEVKSSLGIVRDRANILLRHVATLRETHLVFPTPNEWPDVLDKFLMLSHMQSEDITNALSSDQLDSFLLKPLTSEGLESISIPDMWRTRPEPDQEREERALVDEYKGEFELTDANENDVNEFVKNKINKYNEMVNKLSKDFSGEVQKFKKELSATSAQAESVKPYSLKINMPDKYDLLYAYDEAVRFGEQLNQSESMKKDREEERKRLQRTQQALQQQQQQRQATARQSPEEEQNRMLRELKERSERETEEQMAKARNEAKSIGLRSSSQQIRSGGSSSNDGHRSSEALDTMGGTITPGTAPFGSGEPPNKRQKR